MMESYEENVGGDERDGSYETVEDLDEELVEGSDEGRTQERSCSACSGT